MKKSKIILNWRAPLYSDQGNGARADDSYGNKITIVEDKKTGML